VILVIGAAGKTGQAICRSLVERGQTVRALIRRAEQTARMLELGVQFTIIGDMSDAGILEEAFAGIDKVYLICPNMSPEELNIGKRVIAAAQAAQVERFVYHSVLRPQIQAMPHHWNKLLVEEQLINSGLKMTILQPAAYMQNLMGYWQMMMNEGIYAVPYSVESKMSMVDLEDVAEAAAEVLINEGHNHAIYELCGSEALSANQVAERVTRISGRNVMAQAQDRDEWETRMRSTQLSEFARITLLKMFQYYEIHGFVGNPNILTWLLGRSPKGFEDFIKQQIKLSL
jgi:NAD(P)H dehydrogenase (quinone)